MNKEICKKCWNNYPNSKFGWNELRESQWVNKGFVMCVKKENNAMNTRYVDLTVGPPKQCPYKLEHLVMKKQDKQMKSLGTKTPWKVDEPIQNNDLPICFICELRRELFDKGVKAE